MRLRRIEKIITTSWAMWLFFFICTVVLASFVQLVLIPHLLGSKCHGMFSPDSYGFHRVAGEQTKAMMKYGWKAWQLRPENGYPAGMASIFYYLWYPEPFTVIPFNAVLHATAGYLVFFLLSSFIPNRIAAFSGAALFVLNPGSLEWTAQIHRDGTFILGNLLVLVSWLLISKGMKTEKWAALIYSALIFFMGTILVWLARPYWIQVLTVTYAALIAWMFIHMIIVWHKSRSIKLFHMASVLLVCIMLVTLIPFVKMENNSGAPFSEGYKSQKAGGAQVNEKILHGWGGSEMEMGEGGQFKCILAIRKNIRGLIVIDGQYKGTFFPYNIQWRFNRLVPDFIESKLYSIAVYRLGAVWAGGKSLIDPGVNFMSAADYLSYLPRAVEVGFLSPFPSMWFSSGDTAGTTVGRAVLGVVTIFFYICFVFYIWGYRVYWKNRDFWLVVLYSTYGLLVLTYTYPNLGILNRMRYGFYMTIVSIGFSFLIQKISEMRPTELENTEN